MKKKLSDSSLTIAEKKELLEKNNVTIAALRAKIVELNATNAEEQRDLAEHPREPVEHDVESGGVQGENGRDGERNTRARRGPTCPRPRSRRPPCTTGLSRSTTSRPCSSTSSTRLSSISTAQYNKTHDHDDDHDDHDGDHDGDHDDDHKPLAEHSSEPPLNYNVGDLPEGFPKAMAEHVGIQDGVAFIENCGVPQDIVDFLNKTDSNIEKLDEYFNNHPHYGTFDIAAMLKEMETTWKEHGVCHLDDDHHDDTTATNTITTNTIRPGRSRSLTTRPKRRRSGSTSCVHKGYTFVVSPQWNPY